MLLPESFELSSDFGARMPLIPEVPSEVLVSTLITFSFSSSFAVSIVLLSFPAASSLASLSLLGCSPTLMMTFVTGG